MVASSSVIHIHWWLVLLLVSLRLNKLKAQEALQDDLEHPRSRQVWNRAYQIDVQTSEDTCSWDELSHSLLVIPSNNQHCKGELFQLPTDPNTALHVQSTRSGDRFLSKTLPRIDYVQSEEVRLFDINVTLSVDTSNQLQDVLGFGSNFDCSPLTTNDCLEQFNGLIFADLFGPSEYSHNQFNLLSLRISTRSLITGQAVQTLLGLSYLNHNRPNERLRLLIVLESIIDLDNEDPAISKALEEIERTLKGLKNIECWAIGVEADVARAMDPKMATKIVKSLFQTKFFIIADLMDATKLVELVVSAPFDGILVKAKYSSPYSTIDFIGQQVRRANKTMITMSSEIRGPSNEGNWSKAQKYALELLNLLRYGANGIIETCSAIDPQNGLTKDCSLLKSGSSEQLRTPSYYAMGHFSRFLFPGSRMINSVVRTSPNMFNAHYGAFITPTRHIVAIVLNDNEHMVPMELIVNGIVMIKVDVEPKSFNNIVIKLD